MIYVTWQIAIRVKSFYCFSTITYIHMRFIKNAWSNNVVLIPYTQLKRNQNAPNTFGNKSHFYHLVDSNFVILFSNIKNYWLQGLLALHTQWKLMSGSSLLYGVRIYHRKNFSMIKLMMLFLSAFDVVKLNTLFVEYPLPCH